MFPNTVCEIYFYNDRLLKISKSVSRKQTNLKTHKNNKCTKSYIYNERLSKT